MQHVRSSRSARTAINSHLTDGLVQQARAVIQRKGRVSTNLLRQQLRVTHLVAGQILLRLERDGVVTSGGRKRKFYRLAPPPRSAPATAPAEDRGSALRRAAGTLRELAALLESVATDLRRTEELKRKVEQARAVLG